MHKSEYENMFKAETDYWWFVAKAMYLKRILGDSRLSSEMNRVLDLGAGTGGIHPYLKSLGKVVALDEAGEALMFSKKRGTSIMARGDATKLPFGDDTFSAVMAMDLFEHVVDDHSAALEIARVLEYQGRLVISVPAHQSLFGPHDKSLGHFRRYSKKSVNRLLTLSGFQVERITYTYFASSPAMILFKLYQKFIQGTFGGSSNEMPSYEISPTLNALFKALSALDCWLMDRGNLPFGMSILALARKL